MSATLDAPVTTKERTSLTCTAPTLAPLRCVHSSMQGWRSGMEDRHLLSSSADGFLLLAVFDGHGGDEVADAVSKALLPALRSSPSFETWLSLPTHPSTPFSATATLLTAALQHSYRTVDAGLVSLPSSLHVGSTSNALLVTPSSLLCSNIGDSRSVLCRSGFALPLSADHKPSDDAERRRIRLAGGSVLGGRVGGVVAVSRSFGDAAFKANRGKDLWEQQVSSEPDVVCKERDTEADEFALLACDGVWDVLSNEAACRFVRTRLQAGVELQDIADGMLDFCIKQGSKDNMTLVIALFEAGEKLCMEGKKVKRGNERCILS